jgi:predicted transcriptional regulator
MLRGDAGGSIVHFDGGIAGRANAGSLRASCGRHQMLMARDIETTEHDVPVRLLVRRISELLLVRGRRWQQLVPPETLSSFVFEVVLSSSIAHLPFRDVDQAHWIGIVEALPMARPVSCMAIARSMRLPYASVRRRADALHARRVLDRSDKGCRVTASFVATGELERMSALDAEHLARTLRSLAASGYRPAGTALADGVPDLPPGVIERHLLAFALRSVEALTDLYGNATNGIIMAAIVAANVRHITDDPELARLYAQEAAPPPDTERRPVGLRALARELGMPFETVRRRIAALTAAAMVKVTKDGALVPTRVLLGTAIRDDNRRTSAHFEQMLTTLSRLCTGPLNAG